MTIPTYTTLLTSEDAYLRHDSKALCWQIGTSQTALDLSVQGGGVLLLEAWRHLPTGTAWVEQPHTPLYIEIDEQAESGGFRYERFAFGTDPDDSLFVDIWLRHRQRGLLAHLFFIVYPGSSFIATFVRIQNGTPEEIRLTRLSALHLHLHKPAGTVLLTSLRLVDGKLITDTPRSIPPPGTQVSTDSPRLYLLHYSPSSGLLYTLETETIWRSELVEHDQQLVLDAGLKEGEMLLAAQLGRIDTVQALIGHVTQHTAGAELHAFIARTSEPVHNGQN